MSALHGSVSYGNAQVNLAYATLLLNVAVQAYETKAADVGGMEAVKLAISGGAEFLHAAGKTESEDSVYRALAAVGTLASMDDKSKAVRSVAFGQLPLTRFSACQGVPNSSCGQRDQIRSPQRQGLCRLLQALG